MDSRVLALPRMNRRRIWANTINTKQFDGATREERRRSWKQSWLQYRKDAPTVTPWAKFIENVKAWKRNTPRQFRGNGR